MDKSLITTGELSVPGMMIFSGKCQQELAQHIADHLMIPLGKAQVGHFSDGENPCRNPRKCTGREIFIVQSTCAPSNDNLMELIIMADALRRASAAPSLLLCLILATHAKTDVFALPVCPLQQRSWPT